MRHGSHAQSREDGSLGDKALACDFHKLHMNSSFKEVLIKEHEKDISGRRFRILHSKETYLIL